jgi:hypothetical protein
VGSDNRQQSNKMIHGAFILNHYENVLFSALLRLSLQKLSYIFIHTHEEHIDVSKVVVICDYDLFYLSSYLDFSSAQFRLLSQELELNELMVSFPLYNPLTSTATLLEKYSPHGDTIIFRPVIFSASHD